MSLSRLIFCLTTCVLLSACTDREPEKAELFVFGTLVNISLSGSDPATTESVFQGLQQMFQAMHKDLHAWEPGQLTTINHAFATGQPIIIDRAIAELIQQSQNFETASGGRFNPAIGKLIGRWGFHTSNYPIQAPIPASNEIAQLLAAKPSSLDIQLHYVSNDQWEAQTPNPAVQLDFGGIAKGYAVDLAIDRLQASSMEGSIVNAGGDLRAFGSNQGRAWRVAVQNPLGGIIGIIETVGTEAIFTSGNYQRFGQDKTGFRYAHILDPRSGWPVNQVMSATVIADTGISADAAATALVVAGLDEWSEVAAGMGLEYVLLTDESGNAYMTQAMQSRLQLSGDFENKVILLD
jgi:thiamine biosynthesis lipoprotein